MPIAGRARGRNRSKIYARFVEAKINHYGKAIVTGGDKMDDLTLGELTFYIALRRALKGTASTQDKGLLDAVDDTLQALGILDAHTSFYFGSVAQ